VIEFLPLRDNANSNNGSFPDDSFRSIHRMLLVVRFLIFVNIILAIVFGLALLVRRRELSGGCPSDRIGVLTHV